MKVKSRKHETFTNKLFANITSLCSGVQQDCKHVVHLCHKKGLVIFFLKNKKCYNWACHARMQYLNFKVEVITQRDVIDIAS
jgi:hypothetical protein